MPESKTWTDSDGVSRKVPTGTKLHYSKVPLHAMLRAFVFRRDEFKCKLCGAEAVDVPVPYTGKWSLPTTRKSKSGFISCMVIDHVVSRRNGGSNHPDNLQALCDSCNAAKSGLVDSKVGK